MPHQALHHQSSVINYHQMEPPSNQSFYGNNYNTPLWPEEDRMIGMKTPYPFSLDNPQGPSFLYKFPPALLPAITRSRESASCVNGGTVNFDQNNPVFSFFPPKKPQTGQATTTAGSNCSGEAGEKIDLNLKL